MDIPFGRQCSRRRQAMAEVGRQVLVAGPPSRWYQMCRLDMSSNMQFLPGNEFKAIYLVRTSPCYLHTRT